MFCICPWNQAESSRVKCYFSAYGDHPPLPDVVTQAAADLHHGTSLRTTITILANDESNPLAAALARLGRTLDMRNRQ